MKLVSHQINQPVNPFIKRMWIVEEAAGDNIEVTSFPTGYPFLNVICGSKFRIKNTDNDSFETNSYLAGPTIHPFDLNMKVIRRALTIQLQPFAIPYLIGVPASEFYDQVLPINIFNKELGDRLEDIINGDLSSELVLKETELILMNTCANFEIETRVQHALNIFLQMFGNISVSNLCEKLNLSQRRLQQIFKSNIGMSAKSYSRIVKMQYHTFKLLNNQKLEIIPDGYYDQSHFIHELKKQTGMLPSQFSNYINNPNKKPAYLFSNLYYF